MKKTIRLIAVVFGLAFAGGASAQMLSNAYIGAGVGSTNIKLNSGDIAGFSSKDESDMGMKFFGGYRFNNWLSGELAFADLGKSNVTFPGVTAEGKATSWSLSALGTWPLTGGFSLLGRLGATSNKFKGSCNGAGCTGASNTKTDLLWGIGGQYDFSPRIGVRLEWEDYGRFGNDPTSNPNATGRAKVDMLSGSVVFRF